MEEIKRVQSTAPTKGRGRRDSIDGRLLAGTDQRVDRVEYLKRLQVMRCLASPLIFLATHCPSDAQSELKLLDVLEADEEMKGRGDKGEEVIGEEEGEEESNNTVVVEDEETPTQKLFRTKIYQYQRKLEQLKQKDADLDAERSDILRKRAETAMGSVDRKERLAMLNCEIARLTRFPAEDEMVASGEAEWKLPVDVWRRWKSSGYCT